jgi:endonuclease/exonuclease/phosphatase family metal-dependent hydrolase
MEQRRELRTDNHHRHRHHQQLEPKLNIAFIVILLSFLAFLTTNINIPTNMSEGDLPDSKRVKLSGSDTEISTVQRHHQEEQQRVTLVTYNVAGCQPSKMAPTSWTMTDSAQAIESEILKDNPDVIALQEIPEQYSKTMLSEGYKLVGTKSTHAPYVALFVRKEIDVKRVKSNQIDRLPVVVGELLFSFHDKQMQQQQRFWIASVHLEPFGEGASTRQKQLQSLVEEAKKEQVPLIIAGDTNMRVAEDYAAENASDRGGLGLSDLWKLAGGDIRTKYTVCFKQIKLSIENCYSLNFILFYETLTLIFPYTLLAY